MDGSHPRESAHAADWRATSPLGADRGVGAECHAGTASAQGDVSVGGVVEFIAASTDNGEEGFDPGRFSRIIVDYSNTLDSRLTVSGNISYMLNSRDGDRRPWAPDTLFMSVGGGFGTVSMGSHAMALCSLHVRAYALVPSGWWGGHAGVGFGAKGGGWFAEDAGCVTPSAVSYASPSMGGLSAMVSYAPDYRTHQWSNRNEVDNAPTPEGENALEAAVRYAASMGGADIAISAGLQTAEDDALDSTVAGAQLGFGGATVAADWFENTNGDGFTVGAKYTLGSISPGISYGSADYDTGGEATYLTVGATYQVGGGLSVWGEYQDIESTGRAGASDNGEDTVLIGGVVIAF